MGRSRLPRLGGLHLNRAKFQKLAEMRIADAQSLFQAGRYEGAYYLAGYAVECAIKACIAKLVRRHDFLPEREIVSKIYVHDIEKLIGVAGLKNEWENE